MKDRVVGMFDPAELQARHGVGGDVFHVLAEHLLDLIDDAALDTGHIRDQQAVFKEMLMIPDPVPEDFRVEGKNDHIRLADRCLVRIVVAPVDHLLLQGKTD